MEMSSAQDCHAAYKRGVECLNLGRYEAAIQFFSIDILMGCRSVGAYCNLGLARFKLAQQRPMQELDEASQTIDPRACYCPAALYLWGVDTDQAVEYLNDFLRLHPGDAEGYAFRGNIFYGMDQPDKAIADYSEAIRLNPDYADAYNKRSQSYSDLREHQLSADDASEAIRLDSHLPLAYINRAAAYAALGQDAESARDLAQARELGADCTMASEFIDELKSERQDWRNGGSFTQFC